MSGTDFYVLYCYEKTHKHNTTRQLSLMSYDAKKNFEEEETNTKEDRRRKSSRSIHLAAFASFLKKAQKSRKERDLKKKKTQENWHVKDERLYTREKEQNAREQRETPKKRLSLFSRAIVVSFFEKSADFLCVCARSARALRE